MQPYSPRTRVKAIHFLAWLGFVMYEQSVFLLVGTADLNLGQILSHYSLNAGIFYLHCTLLLPQLFARRHHSRYLFSVLLSLVVYALIRTELYLHVFPDPRALTSPLKDSYYRLEVLSLYRGTFFLLVSAGYWFATQALESERQRRRQEQQLFKVENSLTEANLAFLKSQISPHFLFNCLNFLYAQVTPHSAAAKGVLLLSDTMRYALQESHGGKVMLDHEVQHLHNYVALHQLRFNNQLQVRFEIVGNVHFLMVLPLVLITFVENCFKHGELSDAANPVFISLIMEGSQLHFCTRNKKRTGPKEKGTSIGLSNTQRRLALVYPERHQLSVTDEHDYYTANLIIDL